MVLLKWAIYSHIITGKDWKNSPIPPINCITDGTNEIEIIYGT